MLTSLNQNSQKQPTHLMILSKIRPLKNVIRNTQTEKSLDLISTKSAKQKNIKLINKILKENNTKKIVPKIVGKIRHYPPANKEWKNSIYAYNKNNLRSLACIDNIAGKAIKSYFNLNNNIKLARSRRMRNLIRRKTLKRIFVSKPEIKQTNNKVNITVYVLNREKQFLLRKLFFYKKNMNLNTDIFLHKMWLKKNLLALRKTFKGKKSVKLIGKKTRRLIKNRTYLHNYLMKRYIRVARSAKRYSFRNKFRRHFLSKRRIIKFLKKREKKKTSSIRLKLIGTYLFKPVNTSFSIAAKNKLNAFKNYFNRKKSRKLKYKLRQTNSVSKIKEKLIKILRVKKRRKIFNNYTSKTKTRVNMRKRIKRNYTSKTISKVNMRKIIKKNLMARTKRRSAISKYWPKNKPKIFIPKANNKFWEKYEFDVTTFHGVDLVKGKYTYRTIKSDKKNTFVSIRKTNITRWLTSKTKWKGQNAIWKINKAKRKMKKIKNKRKKITNAKKFDNNTKKKWSRYRKIRLPYTNFKLKNELKFFSFKLVSELKYIRRLFLFYYIKYILSLLQIKISISNGTKNLSLVNYLKLFANRKKRFKLINKPQRAFFKYLANKNLVTNSNKVRFKHLKYVFTYNNNGNNNVISNINEFKKIKNIYKIKSMNKYSHDKLKNIERINLELLTFLRVIMSKIQQTQVSKLQQKDNTILNNEKIDKLYKNFEKKFFMKFLTKFFKKEYLYINYYSKFLINSLKFGKFLPGLKFTLSKIYSKKVKLNIVNLKYPHLNSDIYANLVANNLKKKVNLLKVLKWSLSSAKLPMEYYSYDKANDINKLQTLDIYKTLKIDNFSFNKSNRSSEDKLNMIIKKLYPYSFAYLVNKKDNINEENKIKSKNQKILNIMKYKWVSGVRLEAAGRLTRRYTAARSVYKYKYKGSLKNIDYSQRINNIGSDISNYMLRNSVKSNSQYAFTKSKKRIGAFGLKAWIASY